MVILIWTALANEVVAQAREPKAESCHATGDGDRKAVGARSQCSENSHPLRKRQKKLNEERESLNKARRAGNSGGILCQLKREHYTGTGTRREEIHISAGRVEPGTMCTKNLWM